MKQVETRPVALVVGATGGIGSVIVESLLENDYLVCGTGFRHGPNFQNDCLLEYDYLTCNLQEYSSVLATVEHIHHEYGRCDLLVFAHGASPCIGPTEDLRYEDFVYVQQVDISGPFLLSREIGKIMIAQGRGSIIFLSSIHALGTYPERTAYSTSKSAICGLARSLAVEWARHGLQVNTIAPGQVEGARTANIAASQGEDILAKMKSRVPAGKFVQAHDVAETVLWLIKTPSVTGQTIVLDYGLTSSTWYGDFPQR